MAAVQISDEEDDIWNYTSSVSSRKATGEERGSKSAKAYCSSSSSSSSAIPKERGGSSSSTIPKERVGGLSSSTREHASTETVIHIDSDEDFSFPNARPAVNNEKSAVEWASMFGKAKSKSNDCVVDNHHSNKNSVVRKNKRKLVPSRSPLKTKTNYPGKSRIDSNISPSKSRNQTSMSDCSNSKSVMNNYFSPKKSSPKKLKASGSDSEEFVDLFNKIDDVSPQSSLTMDGEEDIGDGKMPPCPRSGTSPLPCSHSINSNQSQYASDNSSDSLFNDKTISCLSKCDEPNPKIVDVIVVEDDTPCNASSTATTTNKTFLVDAFPVSDTDKVDSDSDLEISGGFIRDPCGSLQSSQQLLENSSEDKFTTSSHSSSSSCNNNPDSESISSKGDAPTVPSVSSSTAARKQISISSFFSTKASISTSKPKIDSVVKGNAAVPSLATKSVTFPPRSMSHQGGRDVSNKSTSSAGASGNYGNKQFSGGRGRQQRECPFYKRMPGTSLTVDAFRYGEIPDCHAYFLTHFHYDHYGGLTKKFSQPIYCSVVTGNLVERRLGVDKRWIHRLPLWTRVVVEGVTLTLMEANHCPGAVIVLFETKNGKKILHTGDFRASLEMEDYPALKNVLVDELYLDTTYCNPSYTFPSQQTVMEFAVSLVEKQMRIDPNTLVVCGAYTIGKERIFTAIAKALDSKICVMSDKKKVLDCLDDDDLKKRVTLSWSEGRVHVLPMAKLRQEPLFDHHRRHPQYTSVLAFEPTGWTHSNTPAVGLDGLRPKWNKNGVTLYGVPYSEHSSYLEMKRFVQFIRPKKILPTVNNGNAAARQKMETFFADWLRE